MPVRVLVGDLLQSNVAIIGHQVNTQGAMGAGIALSIKTKYPEVYPPYREFCRTRSHPLGGCQIVPTQDGRYVANLFGQERFGRGTVQTNYVALGRALRVLKSFAQAHQLSVGLPYGIGCDRGGGKWPVVLALITEVFQDYPVFLYHLQ